MKLKQKWAKMTFSLDYNLKIFFSGGLTFGGKGIKFSGVEVYWGGGCFQVGGLGKFWLVKGDSPPSSPVEKTLGCGIIYCPFSL